MTFVFVRRYVPETKGKTLEEIQQMWDDEAELAPRSRPGSSGAEDALARHLDDEEHS